MTILVWNNPLEANATPVLTERVRCTALTATVSHAASELVRMGGIYLEDPEHTWVPLHQVLKIYDGEMPKR